MASGVVGDGDDADILTTQLLDEFRSRLDEPLILTIAGDYDLKQSYSEARQSLLQIAVNVALEEASGFNASGLAFETAASELEPPHLETDTANTATESSRARTSDSERTSLFDVASERSDACDGVYQTLDTTAWTANDKEAELQLSFPDLPEFDIKYALKTAAGDLNKAYDELLNIQYLEDIGERPKGVDAFFVDDNEVVRRRKKGANKTNKSTQKRVDLDYKLTPLNIDSIEAEPVATAGRGTRLLTARDLISPTSRTPEQKTSTPSVKPLINPADWQTTSARKSKPKPRERLETVPSPSYRRELAHVSFDAAHLAARRGRSDPLLRPYAGILAERGHEHMRAARRQERAQWEALVDKQSSLDSVDLHGVPVGDGVRIALQRAELWWDSFGEDRVRTARQQPLTVITGSGYHSANGVSRMRQQVGAALERYGWKTMVDTGQFIVTGRKAA